MAEQGQQQAARTTALHEYVAALTVAAVAIFVGCVWWFGSRPVGSRWPELVLFGVLVAVYEVKPVTVARSSGVKAIVASTTFSFALFLSFGPVLAMTVQAAASLIGDFLARKSALKMLFNVIQYWIAWGLAAVAFGAVGGEHALAVDLGWQWSIAVLAAGTVYFLANNSLVGVAIGLSGGDPIPKVVVATISSEAMSDCVLLALSPIVIIVAEQSLVFLPLLLLPVFAVYKSASISTEKEYQALHDLLTGLPNRLSFSKILQRRLTQSRLSSKAAILLIDLDRFKEVNDTLGHQAGDQLLAMIGPRLIGVMRADTVIARLGGDEFAVLLPDVKSDNEAAATAQRIADALDDPFPIDDFNLEVEASIGIAMFPEHGDTGDGLLKHADIAMYVAKGRHSGVELYNPEQDTHSTKRLRLVSELRRAIADNEIVLFYQPKLDLSTGQINGVEALVRWIHPDHGLIMPSDFVPVAEHTGLIRPLTSYVIATAVAQAAQWVRAGHELAVAVNLSARSLHDGAVVHDVATNLARQGLRPSLLQLEITESSIMADPARAHRILAQLHEMGLTISIDDFGTGYSSLAYLQQLPVSEIKIDRSFVTNVVHSEGDQVIVRSTIDLARNLGLTSTAEGVESGAALTWLHEAGCDRAQGYHIARPMPAHALADWLTSWRHTPPDTAMGSVIVEIGDRTTVSRC